jgi:Fic family protein
MYVEKPPTLNELIEEVSDRLPSVFGHINTLPRAGEYLHWDKLRHLEPPEGLSHRDWWLLLKLNRNMRPLPLLDARTAEPFTFTAADQVQRLQHFIDQTTSGAIAMPEVVIADEQARRHYLVNSLMEEAIRSSQLEGATTSRRVAKELLQSGRPPRNRSERMIRNNYQAFMYMRELGDELTPDHVLTLQRILTEGTLDNPDAAGRLQRPDEERIVVMDRDTGEVLHVPPPAEQLPRRLELLCQFANASGDGEEFLHPVIRSILLHFWMGYDHPFEDGNGRTARIIFYWSMRKHGYWLTEYLSISKILRQAPSKYARSYLLSESDSGDTTYFVLYQLEVIKRAVGELHTYLERKIREVRQVEEAVKGSEHFNHRQLALISDAVRNPEHVYTFRSHATVHNVTEETARTDLRQLAFRGLLTIRKSGRQFVFDVPPDLSERLTARANGSDGASSTK